MLHLLLPVPVFSSICVKEEDGDDDPSDSLLFSFAFSITEDSSISSNFLLLWAPS